MSASATPKKTVAKKSKKPAAPAAHPTVAVMVDAAIKNLKERKGSSLVAIKKYINANYKADAAKLAPFIRRYLKKSVETGRLSQVKGTGASGSFRLNKDEKKTTEKKAKKPAAKKAKKAKKPAAAKKAKTPKKAAKKAKTPKKAAKKPAAAAKPKKAKTPKKKAAAKKTAAKK